MPSRSHLFLFGMLSIACHASIAFSPLIASVKTPSCNDAIKNDIEKVVHDKLNRIASGFEDYVDKTLRMMDMEIQLSEKTEICLLGGTVEGTNKLLSEKTRRKRKYMKECLLVNNIVVKRLLLGWGSEGGTEKEQLFDKVACIPLMKDGGELLGNGGVAGDQMKEIEGYDTAQQVITHTARDWTYGSSSCRDATNGWIINAITNNCVEMDKINVLVPGSGLCRLAYDISTINDLLLSGTEISVEANDSSVTMAFAAKSTLELVQRQAVSKIYPFVSDPQRNEILASKRFDMEVFPDDTALSSYKHYYSLKKASPNLTYTVGDFSSTYSHKSKHGLYNVIATSFFMDTATNIYEYIFIMKHLLKKDHTSIWVNCGPVQWHPCAMLRPTIDELKDTLEACGFELITWEIAEKTVAYRHPDDFAHHEPRYTREEGYRPLRFVARLSEFEAATDLSERIEYVEYLNEVANGKIKE